jgi:hypothetical protein
MKQVEKWRRLRDESFSVYDRVRETLEEIGLGGIDLEQLQLDLCQVVRGRSSSQANLSIAMQNRPS